MHHSKLVDDLINISSKRAVYKMKANLKKLFDCTDKGKKYKYVSYKLDVSKNKRSIKITKLVLLQSFNDEFKLLVINPKISLLVGCIMSQGKINELINI